MQLSKLKTALSGLARKPESVLTITPSLSLHISSIDIGNTDYVKRQTDFFRDNPDHPGVVDNKNFFNALWRHEFTDAHYEYLANVVITGWRLLDDEGKEQPFSPAECLELLTLPHGIGYGIAAQVQSHATTTGNYQIEWEQAVTKNS